MQVDGMDVFSVKMCVEYARQWTMSGEHAHTTDTFTFREKGGFHFRGPSGPCPVSVSEPARWHVHV